MADSLPPLDERLIAMLTHDLLNPLNGIYMSWSYLDDELAADPREGVRDSHRLVGDCARMMHAEIMLLADYVQLSRASTGSEPIAVDPRAFLTAIVKERRRRRAGRPRNEITLNLGGPVTVPFDAGLARIAARLALDNTLIAAGPSANIRIDSRWDDQRWRTAFVIEKAGPSASSGPAVRHPLHFDQPFKHLLGDAEQREGLDLALVAWISARLKGRAYLKGVPGQPDTIVLDWQIPASAAT